MQIAGLQKLTLLDFPNKMSCIVFTRGCNLACPFCHNADLVQGVRKNDFALFENENTAESFYENPALPIINETEVFEFLNKRKNVLEGVCITGGEPLLWPELPNFIKRVRSMGYAVKLDTNGCFPYRLQKLLDEKLLDYIAMDIKNCEAKYDLTAGAAVNFADILKSAKIIMTSGINYEFRTTLVNGFHTISDVENIGRQFKSAARFYLQKFVDSGNIIKTGLSPLTDDEMQIALKTLQKYIPNAKIR